MSRFSDKVSIVLPTFNGSRYLRGAVESCLRQTHANLEIIIVDDCSNDETPAILASFSDPRLKIIRNAVNQRLPKSLNIGFRAATGDYLTWTSDDNEYDPDAIEVMLGALKDQADADFVYTDYWAFYEDTGEKERVSNPKVLNLPERNTIGACFLYTRRVYQAIGDYNPNYEIVEDYDYWIRISRKFKIIHLDRPIYLYRYHSRTLTTTQKPNQDLFDAILKYRNGYAGAAKLGWTIAYYYDNVAASSLTSEQKSSLIRKTHKKIKGLSLFFAIQFQVLRIFFSIFKKIKHRS